MKLEAIRVAVMKFVNDEDGLTVVEYAIAGGLVSLAVVAAFTNLGAAVAAEIGRLVAVINS